VQEKRDIKNITNPLRIKKQVFDESRIYFLFFEKYHFSSFFLL
jgi:hypothetical protein